MGVLLPAPLDLVLAVVLAGTLLFDSLMASPFDGDDDGIAPSPESVGLPAKERDYLIPSKDSQGRSIRITCRVAPETARLVAEVHQSHHWPFRVQGDLVRFAIANTAKRLAVAAGLDGSVIALGQIMHDMLVEEEYQLQWEDNFRLLSRVIDKYMARGAPAKAREIVTRMRMSIQGMDEGYWKDQYEAEILKKYGALLDRQGQEPASTPSSLFDDQEVHDDRKPLRSE